MKLNLLFHIRCLNDNTLAKMTFNNQKEYKFPGLVTEMQYWLHHLNLPDIINKKPNISKKQFKNLVSKAINDKCQDELREDIKSFKKIRDDPMKDELFEKKLYLNELPLNNVRQNF